jgi:hypothetical protein
MKPCALSCEPWAWRGRPALPSLRSLEPAGGGRGEGRGLGSLPASCAPSWGSRRWQVVGYRRGYQVAEQGRAAGAAEGEPIMEDQNTQETAEVTVSTVKAKKGGAKAPAKGKAKTDTKWKKDPKRLAATKREWPEGSLVKYIGTRVSEHTGKTGAVIGYRDAHGLILDFGKAGKGAISVPNAEMIRRGPGKKEAAG